MLCRSSDLSLEPPNDLQTTSKLKSDKCNWFSIPLKDTLHALRESKRGMFQGHHRPLEVIRRTFGGSKLKCDKLNRLSVLKNLWKDILYKYHKLDLVKDLCFQVIIDHLRSFGGNFFSLNSILISAIDLYKDTLHAPKGDFVIKFCFHVSVGHLRSFGGQTRTIGCRVT